MMVRPPPLINATAALPDLDSSHKSAANTQPGHSKFTTRPATQTDLPFLPAIFNHYISTTAISFRLEHVGAEFFEEILASVTERGLPFIVATVPSSTSIDPGGVRSRLSPEQLGGFAEGKERVIGYVYALPFRQSYAAYRRTVEISLYVDHAYHSLGIGSTLMDQLLEELRTVKVPDPSLGKETVAADVQGSNGRVEQVLAIMSLDTQGRDGGLGLEKFYERWGFTRVGHLKKVGFKFGRWIDVLFLQLEL